MHNQQQGPEKWQIAVIIVFFILLIASFAAIIAIKATQYSGFKPGPDQSNRWRGRWQKNCYPGGNCQDDYYISYYPNWSQ